jgi:Mg-chelatase subunit ChlD
MLPADCCPLQSFFCAAADDIEQKFSRISKLAMQVSHNISSGQILHTDFARKLHEFLIVNGHTSVDTRMLLSQLGAALAHLKPADPAFKWSQLFAAHPSLFQMLDLHVPGKATIYALPKQNHHHRPQGQMVHAPSKKSPQSSSALVSAGSTAGSALAVGLEQRGFSAKAPSAQQQQVEVKQRARKTNVVVVLDLSGSMADELFGRLTLAKAAVMQLWDVLMPGDSLTIITFNTRVNIVMPRRFKWEPKEGQVKRPTQFERSDLEAAVGGLEAVGGTALYHALLEAMEQTKAAATEDLIKAKAKKCQTVDSNTFQLFVITDGQDQDSASISRASTAQAVNEVLRKPGGWAGQVKFSSCFVAIGEEARSALAPCTNGLNPENHHTVDNITEGFRRVTDTIATVRVQQTQTFKKSSVAFGGGSAAG